MQIGWIESAYNTPGSVVSGTTTSASNGTVWDIEGPVPMHDVAQGTGATNVRSGWLLKFYKTEFRMYYPAMILSAYRGGVGFTAAGDAVQPEGIGGVLAAANSDNWKSWLLSNWPKCVARHYLVAINPTYAAGLPTAQQIVDDFTHFYGAVWNNFVTSGTWQVYKDNGPRIDKRLTEFKSAFRIIKKWKTFFRPGKPIVCTGLETTGAVKGNMVMFYQRPHTRIIKIKRMMYQTYDGTNASDLERPAAFYIFTQFMDTAANLHASGWLGCSMNTAANSICPGGFYYQFRSFFRYI